MEKRPLRHKNEELGHDVFSGIYTAGVEQLRAITTKYGLVSLASDIGVGYSVNEDRVFMDTSRNIFGVADGIGGYPHGAEAAQIIAEEIVQGIKAGVSPQVIQFEASSRMKQNQILMGGACYLYFQIEKKSASIFWAGDVQLKLFDQNGNLEYSSKSTEIAKAPRGQSAGIVSSDSIDVMNYSTIIAASDGLWDNVDTGDVAEIVKNTDSREPNVIAKKLFNLAKKGMEEGFLTDYGGIVPGKRIDYGKNDNISIVVFQKLPLISTLKYD